MEMLYFLIALIAGIILEIILMKYVLFKMDSDEHGTQGCIFATILLILGVCLLFTILFYCSFGLKFISSKTAAEIINQEYGTSYSTMQVFWAPVTIQMINETRRNNYNVTLDHEDQ